MDGDPAVEPELDAFSLTLPLPYRVSLIIVLAVWAWGANLQYLHLLKIDVPSLIRYPSRSSPHQPTHHLSTYRLAFLLTGTLSFSLFVFWVTTHHNATLVLAYDWLPMTCLLAIGIIFFLPLTTSRTGRYRFLSILKRVSIGGIATAENGKFGDILLADVLTSYAKVLGDLFVSICMFITPSVSATQQPNRGCGGQFMVPLIIAIPSLIRLRQCLIEYGRVRDSVRREGRIGAQGWGGQHLANAAKYASAFPVIILSALQRSLSLNHTHVGLSEAGLFRLWLFAVMFNSCYSFYWDVAKDWDLTLFSPAHIRKPRNNAYPYALRPRRFFHAPEMYYVAIGLDFLLRCTWSLKLSPHLDHFNDLEGGIFVMEVLEVLRRWIWIFFRVETEWVRSSTPVIGQDEILLADFGKEDDD